MNRFWRALAIFLLGGVLGTGFGVALGFFVYPFVFPPPPAADQLSEADKAKLATGTFVHANPSDPIHWGRGTVSVYERAVFLEPDFEVGPGPAFHVYLVPKSGIRKNSDLGDAMFVDLGGLRFQGQPALHHPGRRRPEELPECHHLVPAVQRADLACGFDREVATHARLA